MKVALWAEIRRLAEIEKPPPAGPSHDNSVVPGAQLAALLKLDQPLFARRRASR